MSLVLHSLAMFAATGNVTVAAGVAAARRRVYTVHQSRTCRFALIVHASTLMAACTCDLLARLCLFVSSVSSLKISRVHTDSQLCLYHSSTAATSTAATIAQPV